MGSYANLGFRDDENKLFPKSLTVCNIRLSLDDDSSLIYCTYPSMIRFVLNVVNDFSYHKINNIIKSVDSYILDYEIKLLKKPNKIEYGIIFQSALNHLRKYNDISDGIPVDSLHQEFHSINFVIVDNSGNDITYMYDRLVHKTSRRIPDRLRLQVLKRDKYKCMFCGASPATDQTIVLVVDHIKPWAKGGETEINNLQTLCSKCNSGKSDTYDA